MKIEHKSPEAHPDVLSAARIDIAIGIDPGVNTGLCIIKLGSADMRIETTDILTAMEAVKLACAGLKHRTLARVEDARKRKFFGNTGREVLQGAGSVKRDCQIWEDFLRRERIPFQMVAPKDNRTKAGLQFFQQLTGHTGRTSEHARDAAMLVWGIVQRPKT